MTYTEIIELLNSRQEFKEVKRNPNRFQVVGTGLLLTIWNVESNLFRLREEGYLIRYYQILYSGSSDVENDRITSITFETFLNQLPKDLQELFLFHLDVFSRQ